jgi:hypothetical protein
MKKVELLWTRGRLVIGFRSKSGTCPGISFKKAGHIKIQTSFQEKWSRKAGN